MKSEIVLLSFFITVYAIGEVFNSKIAVTPPRQACIDHQNDRPCAFTYISAQLNAGDIPPDHPCPCPANGQPGGGIYNPTGTTASPNPDKDFFEDYVLIDGIDNPIDMSFSDTTKELYVGTRPGLIWYIDLETGLKRIFADLTAEVGMSGDRGLMSIQTTPNFVNTRQILAQFTVNPTPEAGEPNPESSVNQRLIRLEDMGAGVMNPNFRLTLIGAGDWDGVPICYNTHAVGSVRFGLDGSLFVSTGEGAHWNFDFGDFGQNAAFTFDLNGQPVPSLDTQCDLHFADQDVGAFRSQVYNSLGGKILRIGSTSGDGICPGSAEGDGYPIKNPFCDASNGKSIASKIWALGVRNPFRMTVRPNLKNEAGGAGPGIVFFGDVGQGGYEEINAAKSAGGGDNFGWPCWEGPNPAPSYRDSPFNHALNPVTSGCPGIEGMCGNITTPALLPNGDRITCPYMYFNMTTTTPFFYYSRFPANDDAGYFSENGYLGQGFQGTSTVGVQFYTGASYPPQYYGSLFIMDYANMWIRVITLDEQQNYESIQDFTELVYTPPTDGGKVTLASGPNGDICYLTLNGGEVRCFRYKATNVAPTVQITYSDLPQPLSIAFSSDGTFDRENDAMIFSWDFGDGTKSALANPTHTYSAAGKVNVTLSVTDKFGNVGTNVMSLLVGNKKPIVSIASPAQVQGKMVYYTNNQNLTFTPNIQDENVAQCQVYWEVQFVHYSHIHPSQTIYDAKSFSIIASNIPHEDVTNERVNLKMVLHVIDDKGIEATDFIRMSPSNVATLYPNTAPKCAMDYNQGFSPITAGQPVRFSGQRSSDDQNDRIDMTWVFGENTATGSGVTATHAYAAGGDYTVSLLCVDNFGASNNATITLHVNPASTIPPVSSLGGPGNYQIFEATNVLLKSIEPGVQIFYTLDGSVPTTASNLYGNGVPIAFVPFTTQLLSVIAHTTGKEDSAVQVFNISIAYPQCNQMAMSVYGRLVCVNDIQALEVGTILQLPYSPIVQTLIPPSDLTLRRDFTIDYLNGQYDATRNSATNMTRTHIWLDQGSTVGSTVTARIMYDFTGDGTFDRTETFFDFAPDPVATTFEVYDILDVSKRYYSVTGSPYQPLVNGTIQFTIWNSIPPQPINNKAPLTMRVGASPMLASPQLSTISIPYNSYRWEVVDVLPTTSYSNPTSEATMSSSTQTFQSTSSDTPRSNSRTDASTSSTTQSVTQSATQSSGSEDPASCSTLTDSATQGQSRSQTRSSISGDPTVAEESSTTMLMLSASFILAACMLNM